ncbi:MAG: hypothetical protein ACK5RE_11410 [Pseudanabaena sp.]|jgi:hypothetical protein
MNTKLVESIIQIVLSFNKEEQDYFTERLFHSLSEPSTHELTLMAQNGKSLDFLDDEPDLYTLTDGEPVS